MVRNIKLLGAVLIEENGRTSPLTKNAKGCALLAYLTVTGQSQPREAVADLLWEATTTAQSLRNLRVLLTRIRPWLPELQTTRTTLAFQTHSQLTFDLEKVIAGLEQEDIAGLDKGLRAYGGDLLANFYLEDAPRFNEWLRFTQARLRQQVAAAFDQVCEGYAAQQQWSKGIDAAHRWLALDDLDERPYRWLMFCLAQKGQASQALQQYDICRQRLWQELGVEPEAATIALVKQIAETVTETPFAWANIGQPIWPQPDELAEPGPLPTNAIMPYRRNNDFVGRQDALLQLARLLMPTKETTAPDNQPAAITGMGGMGKTQLAVEFCYRYGRYFPGGVYWLNFDADNIPEELAHIGGERGMGLYQETEQLTLADKVGRVQKAWQEPTPRLLIFDNCEEEQLLIDWLPVTGGCRVLLTSRRGQWSREFEINAIPLNVLSSEESLSLLQHLAPRLNEKEAREIAEEVGHLPLALHLAGGFLHSYQQISPAQYLCQLRDKGLLQHPSLQGRGLSLSPTNHELNVARTFALNITRLDLNDEMDAMTQRLLVAAACFAPGEPIPQELLREIVIGDEEDLMLTLLAEDGLARVVTLGFLEAEGKETVILHRLLAAFILEEMAAEPLIDSVQTVVENTLVRQLATTLEDSLFRGILPILTTHLRHVLEIALLRPSKTAGLLALALGRHLHQVGEFAAAQFILEKGLTTAETAGDIYTQGCIMSVLSRAYFSQGFHRRAHYSALEAERLLRLADSPDQKWLIRALDRRGWAHLRLGEAEQALTAAKEVWQLSVRTDNQKALAECMNLLGSVHYFLLGEYEVADRYFADALLLYKQMNERSGEATILLNQAENATTRGEYHHAKALIQEALGIVREVGTQMRELAIHINLSEVQNHLGEYDTAVATMTKVLTQAPKDWTYGGMARKVLAHGHLGLGEIDKALALIQTTDSFENDDDPYDTGEAWYILGLIAARLNQPVPTNPTGYITYDAPACFAKSISIFTEIGNERHRALVLWAWAKHELAVGDAAKGEAMQQQSRRILEQLNLPRLISQMT